VTLIDKSEFMVAEARKNVAAAGMEDRIEVAEGDILKLPYPDDTFDVSIVEAVTMFVPRFMAVREIVRVTKPGGRIVDQELCWRGAPDAKALEVLHQPNFCPSIDFDDVQNWKSLFEQCGVRDIRTATGPFYLVHPVHFVADEGVANTARVIGRAFSRPAYMRKSVWLFQNVARIMPKCGYIVIGGVKPEAP
jgi:SAM-dependent methyltransferase